MCVCGEREREREKVSVYVCAVCVCLVRMVQSVERQACDQKVAGTLLSRNEGRRFFSRVNFLYCPLFGVCSTPVVCGERERERESKCVCVCVSG